MSKKVFHCSAKMCCFCKHIHDPTSEMKEPKPFSKGFFYIDDTVSKTCLLTHLPRKAVNCCAKFEKKE